jgi:hypothetical protein
LHPDPANLLDAHRHERHQQGMDHRFR